jgi:hypothetical protein
MNSEEEKDGDGLSLNFVLVCSYYVHYLLTMGHRQIRTNIVHDPRYVPDSIP